MKLERSKDLWLLTDAQQMLMTSQGFLEGTSLLQSHLGLDPGRTSLQDNVRSARQGAKEQNPGSSVSSATLSYSVCIHVSKTTILLWTVHIMDLSEHC